MISIFEKNLPFMPFGIFMMMAVQLLITWVFVRFVHYESQNHTLPIDSYSVEVITLDDYAKLQDPSLEVVELSNGTKIMDRQPAWYRIILPNYNKVGDHYVHVTTLGTAHYYFRWVTDALPLVFLTVFGLFCTRMDLRRRTAENIDSATK
jgi:hypothetical protein